MSWFNVQLRQRIVRQAVTVTAVLQTSGLPVIWCCHRDADVGSILLACESIYIFQNQQVFRRNILLSFVVSGTPQNSRHIYPGCSNLATAHIKYTQ